MSQVNVEVSQVNAEVCVEYGKQVLTSTKVSAFHHHPVFCAGLSLLLKQVGVGHFSVKASAAELLNSCEDEALVMDIESIQELDSSSFQRLEQCFAQQTAVVTTRAQLERLGGRLPKNIGSLISPRATLEEFVHAIIALTNQSTYVDPKLVNSWNRVLADPGFELTNRHLQVLRLVARGKTSVQIASLLGVRPKTVENHRAAIKERMGVVSSAEMVNEAHKRGYC